VPNLERLGGGIGGCAKNLASEQIGGHIALGALRLHERQVRLGKHHGIAQNAADSDLSDAYSRVVDTLQGYWFP